MKTLAKIKGQTLVQFKDNKEIFDYIYKRFDEIQAKKHGETVYTEDWIIECAYDTAIEMILKNDRKVTLEYIDKCILAVIDHIRTINY